MFKFIKKWFTRRSNIKQLCKALENATGFEVVYVQFPLSKNPTQKEILDELIARQRGWLPFDEKRVQELQRLLTGTTIH